MVWVFFQQTEFLGGEGKVRRCVVVKLFPGVRFLLQHIHFVSQAAFPIAEPDVLSSLCYEMLSN